MHSQILTNIFGENKNNLRAICAGRIWISSLTVLHFHCTDPYQGITILDWTLLLDILISFGLNKTIWQTLFWQIGWREEERRLQLHTSISLLSSSIKGKKYCRSSLPIISLDPIWNEWWESYLSSETVRTSWRRYWDWTESSRLQSRSEAKVNTAADRDREGLSSQTSLGEKNWVN